MNTYAIKFLNLIIICMLLGSCKVLEQANEMKNFARCEFRLKNIDDVTLAGVDITHVDQFSDLSFAEAGNISMTVMKGKLPLYFVLNVEVRNPNEKNASMNRFLWDLIIDDILITSGKVIEDVKVPPGGGIAIFPIEVGVDLFDVLTGESADAIINFAMNLTSSGSSPSRVKLRAKPTIYVGMSEVKYPGFITIEQEFVSE
jgi:LEA14-like dessication related protein